MSVMRTMCRAARQVRAVQPVARRFLSEAVNQEVEEEKQFLEGMEQPKVPAGWDMQYTEGNGYFRVTKNQDGVDIVVDCEFQAHDTEANSTSFSVVYTKNGISADFTLRYDAGANELSLAAMTTYKSKATACDLTPQAECDRDNHYEGPDVNDLEKTEIPTQVLALLANAGVDEELASFVHKRGQTLEQSAYINFLTDLAKLA